MKSQLIMIDDTQIQNPPIRSAAGISDVMERQNWPFLGAAFCLHYVVLPDFLFWEDKRRQLLSKGVWLFTGTTQAVALELWGSCPAYLKPEFLEAWSTNSKMCVLQEFSFLSWFKHKAAFGT